MLVRELDLPEVVLSLLEQYGVKSLYPPQEAAVRAGLLKGENMVLAAPTASGKTLVAELCMVKKVLEGGRALYLVPLRALASEKFEEFSKWSKLGVNVGISTGDYDSAGHDLEKYDILVCTNEKADALMRHASDFLRGVEVVVADEVHVLNDPDRGATLEVVLTRLKRLTRAQLLALSATIENAGEISDWIQGKLVFSDWRPVPLKEGVFLKNLIEFNDGSKLYVERVGKDPAVDLAFDTVKNGGQALIFESTRRGAVAAANAAAPAVSRILSRHEKRALREVAREVISSGEKTRISEKLSSLIERGVAFHHAGLSYSQRKIVEAGFRGNLIKVLSATPTLAAGVNLPARRVIVRNYKRSEGFGRIPIPVFEYKQMAGRAGRPKYDAVGEAVLIAKSEREKSFLLKEYVNGKAEKVESKLSSERALRIHSLSVIASEQPLREEELVNFFGETFYAWQRGGCLQIIPTLKDVLSFLLENGFIKMGDGMIESSVLGKRVSELYVDPLSAVKIVKGLKCEKEISEIGYLHLICSTPDMPQLYLVRKDYVFLHRFVEENEDLFLTSIPDCDADPVEYEWFLSEVKGALLLKEWIDERGEDQIVERFDVGSGDIYRIVESAEWLTYATCEIAKVLGMHDKLSFLRELRERIKYGVKKELLNLVSLEGVGRVRARILFNAGIKSPGDLEKTPVERLASLPTIGENLARKMKAHVEGKKEVKRRITKLSDFKA
ncbi:MAG: DEAD/DEAH box helicase [Candidatus Freyarchaeota archaeon]|nr:DEAD/DEAH box helicase [Candidatus Freyrarchaeum guaymaensis]